MIDKNIQAIFSKLFDIPFQLQLKSGKVFSFGTPPYRFKVTVTKKVSFRKMLMTPSLFAGEAYMDGTLVIDGNLQEVIESFLRANRKKLDKDPLISSQKWNVLQSKRDISHHYDIGNDFYKIWLDKSMTYSCAYFKTDNDSLEQAQENKVNLVLNKLNIQPNNTLLDIGSGWGELIITVAKKYNAKAIGITLSNEQYDRVKQRIQEENLTGQVEVYLEDYRDFAKRGIKFDRISSVGMLEHVGKKNVKTYFNIVNDLLKDNGLALIHSITTVSKDGYDPWINKYIFPNGNIPNIARIVSSITDNKLRLVDVENLRRHYKKTLEIWADNFENSLEEVRKTKDETFIRMWRMYLNACAASFNYGNIDLHQFLLSKGNNNEISVLRENWK